MPAAQVTTPSVAFISLDACELLLATPTFHLSDNNTQIVSKFLGTLRTHLGTKHMTTTAYHPPLEKVKLYIKTIGTYLRHYVFTHQREFNLYVQPFTYAYNTQIHRPLVPALTVLSTKGTHLDQPLLTTHKPLQLGRDMHQTHNLYRLSCSHAFKRGNRTSTDALTRRINNICVATTRRFVVL